MEKQTPKEFKDLSPAERKKAYGCLFVVLLLIGGLLYTCSTYEPEPEPVLPVVHNSAWDHSVKQVEDYIKANLNDPDSYESVEWSDVEGNDSIDYIVVHTFRAKNAFGGVMTYSQMFVLDSLGNVIGVTPLN